MDAAAGLAPASPRHNVSRMPNRCQEQGANFVIGFFCQPLNSNEFLEKRSRILINIRRARGGGGGGATTSAHALPETLALLRCHLFPALRHPPAEVGTRETVPAKSAEQYPRQHKNSQCL